MRVKIVIVICFLFFAEATELFSQVKDCRLTFLDSNFVKKVYSNVKLEYFKNDKLIFLDSSKVTSVDIKNLIELKFSTDSKPLTGLIVGFGIGFVLPFLLIGKSEGHPDFSLTPRGRAIVAGLALGTSGAVIRAIIDVTL